MYTFNSRKNTTFVKLTHGKKQEKIAKDENKLTSNRKGNTKDNFCNTTENDEAKLIWGKIIIFLSNFSLALKILLLNGMVINSCSIFKSEKNSLNFMVTAWTVIPQPNRYFQYKMKIISSWLCFICIYCKV